MIKKDGRIVFGGNLEKTKKLGRLLSIDKSYAIIRLLDSKEPLTMTAISKKLSIKLPILVHYLLKLDEIGLLIITIQKQPILNKKKGTKYYRIKPFTLSVP